MINNNIELLGFVTMVSEYASLYTNEIQLTQKDMMSVTGYNRKKLSLSLQSLKEVSIIINKYDDQDNRRYRYFIHPYIYFQGKLNISALSCLLDIVDTVEEPHQYITIKDNEVFTDLVYDVLQAQERYVYFIQNKSNNEIKIGVSSNINQRLSDISRSINSPVTLLKLINGDERTEKELHNKFSQYRLHGEWFTPSEPILNYINN